jgi:hypothetical protein
MAKIGQFLPILATFMKKNHVFLKVGRRTSHDLSYFHFTFPESTCSGAYQVSDGFLFQAIWVNKSLSMM